jgi:hypothetical protein
MVKDCIYAAKLQNLDDLSQHIAEVIANILVELFSQHLIACLSLYES